MPIYEYRCEACGHELEKIQRISDDPLRDCPACDEATLRRLISAPAFRLKGSGWYETDFKSGNRRNVAGDAESGSTESKGDKAEAKGDKGESKSAAEPAAKKDSGGTTSAAAD